MPARHRAPRHCPRRSRLRSDVSCIPRLAFCRVGRASLCWCIGRSSHRTNRNLKRSSARSTRRRSGVARCGTAQGRRARQESPPILVEHYRAASNLLGAQPAGRDLVVDAGAPNWTLIRQLADRISELREIISLRHSAIPRGAIGRRRVEPLAFGRSPAACRITELLEDCPSARGAIVPQNSSVCWTWIISGSLSSGCPYNLAQYCIGLVASCQCSDRG